MAPGGLDFGGEGVGLTGDAISGDGSVDEGAG